MANKRGPVVVKEAFAELTGEIVHLRWTADGGPICPVCGVSWPPNAEHAWISGISGITNEAGLPIAAPSWSICFCCNTEFGYEDIPDPGESLESTWVLLRERWLQKVGRSAAALEQVREHLVLDL